MDSKRRIQKEIQNFMQDGGEIPDCSIKLNVGNSLTKFDAEIGGPPNTPYEGGKWRVDIMIPPKYPFAPPTIRFLTQIWHPNITHNDGIICLDTLRENWLSTMTIRTALLSVQSLLETPSFTDPVNATAKFQHATSKDVYERTAKYWTHVLANGPFQCQEYDEKMELVKKRYNYNNFEALTYISMYDWNVDQDGRGRDETI